MKEFVLDYQGRPIKRANLASPGMGEKNYICAHSNLPIVCHDIVIKYEGKILLIKRKSHPARGLFFPVGGRIKRGIQIETSLKNKVKEECNLEIEKIVELGVCRTLFNTDPFGHGKGTDTINIMFFGIGKGKINLDRLHSGYTLLSVSDYKKLKPKLHPYIRHIIDLSIKYF